MEADAGPSQDSASELRAINQSATDVLAAIQGLSEVATLIDEARDRAIESIRQEGNLVTLIIQGLLGSLPSTPLLGPNDRGESGSGTALWNRGEDRMSISD